MLRLTILAGLVQGRRWEGVEGLKEEVSAEEGGLGVGEDVSADDPSWRGRFLERTGGREEGLEGMEEEVEVVHGLEAV